MNLSILNHFQHLNVDLSRSLKVKCDSSIRLPMTSCWYLKVRYGLSSFKRYKPPQSEWPWHWPFKVTEIKCKRTNGLPLYAFLLMFNGNIWPNSGPLQDIRLRNLSDPDFDLSRSLKVNCYGVVWLSIYCFLLIYMYIVTTCLSLDV